MQTQTIGIVIIGRNEGQRLVACLKSIDMQDKVVVYVDSGSTDGSCDVAANAGAIVVNLDTRTPFTAARARNVGFATLRRDRRDIGLVQFVDGDCSLDPAWLDTARRFLETRPDVAVVCGRRRERHPEASIYNAMCDREWDTPIGEALACGGDAMMRVAAFEEAGGYRAQLIAGEEPELCLRLREKGWKIWRLDAEMTAHDAAILRFSQCWKRAMRSGHAYAEVAWLHYRSPLALWKANVLRAIVWGGIVPFIFLLGVFDIRYAALALLLFVAQISRMALRGVAPSRASWLEAFVMASTKPAECAGVARYIFSRALGRRETIIEYK